MGEGLRDPAASIGEEESSLIGWTGHCEYERPTLEAWLRLLAVTLGRAGRGRVEGFGAFRIRVQAGPWNPAAPRSRGTREV